MADKKPSALGESRGDGVFLAAAVDRCMLWPLDALVRVFGPFVLPVLLFAAGVVGYLILVALGRVGIEL